MLCPNDKMQMHQRAQIGDGEDNENVYASWSMQECPVCHRQVVEFHTVIMVSDTEQARMVGRMMVAKASEAAVHTWRPFNHKQRDLIQ